MGGNEVPKLKGASPTRMHEAAQTTGWAAWRRIIQDELNVRKERMLSCRAKAAEFHHLKTLDDFDCLFFRLGGQ